MGYKNLKEMFFTVQPPPNPEGGQDPAMAGRTQPQVGDMGINAEASGLTQ